MKKQAILILAHNHIEMLNNLIRLLDSKYFDIYVHIDLKSNINISDVRKTKTSNIYVFKEKKVYWGDYSQPDTIMFLLGKAIKNNYLYYHLISGSDLPIKPNKKIYNFFNEHFPKEFVHFEDPKVLEYKLDWIKYYYDMKFASNKEYYASMLNNVEKQKADGINRLKNDKNEFRSGASWFSITNTFAKYLYRQKKYIEDRFSYTKMCDEFFVQTILYNSKYKENLYYNKFDSNYESCMRLIDWKRGNPYVWQEKDFKEIMISNRMFARKFDPKTDNIIIKKITRLIYVFNKKIEEK